MKKKKIIWFIIVLIIIAGIVIWRNLIKKEKEEYTLEKVARANVLQEVSETGTVKMGEEIKMSFKRAGTIEQIYVKIGQAINAGQQLAKLDTRELSIQLTDAQAQKEVAQANLNKLLAGATPEELQVKETAVANAKITLENKKQNLEDVKEDAKEDLISAYQDAVNNIRVAFVEIDNTFNLASRIQKSYFSSTDQETTLVVQSKKNISASLSTVESLIDSVKNLVFSDDQANYDKTDQALSGTKKELQTVSDNLVIIHQQCESPRYSNSVSSTDKTSLETEKSAINTKLTSIVNSQQTISSTRTKNQTNINTAQGEVDSAKGALQKAEDELALLKAEPRQEDIDLYQAQVKQAEAKVNLYQRQISDSYLVSPVAGQVTKIEKRIGEMVQATTSDFAIAVLPEAPFQIEVNIYEEDIVKVEIGNPVDINLVAFPNKTFKGKVISIEPAEKIIEEVVYYKTIIDFEEIPEGLKPGMTADITIRTAFRENVLAVSKRAIKKRDSRMFIEVLRNGNIEEKQIETGIWGTDNLVEVLSGLAEGEEIVIR